MSYLSTSTRHSAAKADHGRFASDSPVSNLLARLQGVRERGPGSWLARCPAHADRSPSLSIRETPDGVVLAHCFTGCPVENVLAAVGLEMADLYPPKPADHRGKARSKPPIPWRDVIRSLTFHVTVVAMAAQELAEVRTLPAGDVEAVKAAASFLTRVIEEAR